MVNHPLQNAAQGMIGGSLGAGALSQTIANAQAQAYNQAVMARTPHVKYEKRMTLHVNIEQAGNGFIVGFANHYGEIIDKRVATNIEQVQEIITSEMASRMLEESK